MACTTKTLRKLSLTMKLRKLLHQALQKDEANTFLFFNSKGSNSREKRATMFNSGGGISLGGIGGIGGTWLGYM